MEQSAIPGGEGLTSRSRGEVPASRSSAPPFVTFRTEEEKRLWLRQHAPFSLRILCDHVLAPYRHYGRLPLFHVDRCRELDRDLRLGRNAVNIWTRGLWKSQTISVAHTIQRILRNPNVTILLRHFDEEIAAELVKDVVDHFCANPVLRYVFPEFCPPLGDEKRWSGAKTFTTPARQYHRTEPTLLGEGLNSTVTGRHFDHIHDDDVETPKSVGREVSPEVRSKHWSRWLDWTQLAERPSEDTQAPKRGTYSMVGTPWHYDGIIFRAQERRREFGLVFRWYPAYDDKAQKLLCPQAYPKTTLDRDRSALDAYEFSCAILLSPVDPENAAFRFTDDQYWTLPPDKYPRCWRFMAIDPAYSTDRHSDYTGLVVAEVLPDDSWVVVECQTYRLEPYSLIQEIFELQRFWKCDTIYLETIAAGKILRKWINAEEDRLKERLPLQDVDRHKTQNSRKEKLRIRAVAARSEAGKLRLWKGGKNIYALVDEMKQWPSGKHEHLLDALSMLAERAPRGFATDENTPPKPGTMEWIEAEIELQEEERKEVLVGQWRDPDYLQDYIEEQRRSDKERWDWIEREGYGKTTAAP